MQLLRTPEDAFSEIEGFSFEPHYKEISAEDGSQLRLHYLDEGPPHGKVVLLLHGEPSWSYLYRKMIPLLIDEGLRCVAPDLVGFGRSDKPADRREHSYARHVDWLSALVLGELALGEITLVGQDWGGLIGLRVLAENGGAFSRVVAANTGLPTGDEHVSKAFYDWQRFSQEAPSLPIGRIVAGGSRRELSPGEVAAYDAPFPDEAFKEGPRQLPSLVPTGPDDPATGAQRRAWQVLERFDKPFLCCFSDSDPMTAGAWRPFVERVPGAKGIDHVTIEGAGHFLQEDRPEELSEAISRFVAETS